MKKNNLRRNFIGAVLLIMALLTVIPVITLSLLTREYDARIRAQTERSSALIRRTVHTFMDGAYNLSYEMAENPIILTMNGRLQEPLLVECVRRNEYLELLYIQDTDGNQTARSSGELGYRGHREWFRKIMQTKQPYVQESYYSLATGMPVTSVFIPMYRESELVGIFGADISLQYFQKMAEEFEDSENGTLSFILDGEGVVVAHPDITLLETITNFKTQTVTVPLTDDEGNGLFNIDGSVITEERAFLLSPGYKAVIDDVMAGNRGLEIIQADDDIFYAAYESIEMPGYSKPWSVITLQDRAVAMRSIYDLINGVLVIIAVIFIVVIVITYVFFRSLRNTMEHLELAKNEAEEANKSKSAFLSTMSHEIRTPMNAILGITEILLQRNDIDANIRTALERTYASGNMLLSIINDILDLSKIEAGKLELVVGKYEIASLLSDTAQLNMMRIGSKPIEFALYADENLPTVLIGDELRIKQILNNLLSNAFKYTEKGKVEMTVTSQLAGKKWVQEKSGKDFQFTSLDSRVDDEIDLIFKVSDTGQGMTEEQVSMLFGEYTRFNMEANRKTEGTGLGLNITQKLVEMMDGDISVESRPGEGSVFTAKIRQVRSGYAKLGRELAENLSHFRLSGNEHHVKQLQIRREPMPYGSVMIVDDVETNIYVARGLLAPYGMKIDSTDSGAKAIEKLKDGNVYDIVFMDHMMPEMDGIEATKRIREMGYTHPIVALTANAVSGQAEMFLSSGFDDFISKPIDMRQMNKVLNKFVRDKQPPEVVRAVREKTGYYDRYSGGGGDADSNDTDTDDDTDGGGENFEGNTGESEALDISPDMLGNFLRDANKACAILDGIIEKGGEIDTDDMRLFTINVHGLKSILAVIGKTKMSDTARNLESIGRSEDSAAIAAETPAFLGELHGLIDELTKTAEENQPSGEALPTDSDTALLHEKLGAIKAACAKFDITAVEDVLDELKAQAWPKETKELLAAISGHILHSEFDEIVNLIGD